jgi:DNA-binding transcriptional MerR regulator
LRHEYTTPQAAEILGIPMRKILSYIERGYVRPSILDAEGHGSRRLWSLWDLDKIHLVRRCEQLGLSVALLRSLGKLLTPPLWPDIIMSRDSPRYLVIDQRGERATGQDSLEKQVDSMAGPCLVIPLRLMVHEVREMLWRAKR